MIWAHKELWDLWLAVSSLMATQEACPRPGKRVRLVTFKCTAGEASLKHVRSTRGSVIQFSSLSCVRLLDPMDCSTAGFPVLHYLLDFA